MLPKQKIRYNNHVKMNNIEKVFKTRVRSYTAGILGPYVQTPLEAWICVHVYIVPH